VLVRPRTSSAMRYLRMLSNSLIGGMLAGTYVLVLVLQLNPGLPLNPARLAPLAAAVALFYGAHVAAVFYVLIVVRQIFAAEVLSPGWLSLRLLVWISTIASSGGATLMWMNLRGFGPVLDPRVADRLRIAATIMTGCAAGFLMLAITAFSFGRRGRRAGAAAYVAIAIASVALPLAVRGRGGQAALGARRLDVGFELATSPEEGPRVIIVLLDGGSLDIISPIAAEGRLPNFGKLLDGGAVMHLATLRPTQAAPVWTAVATGKLPYKNGIRSAATYGVGGSRDRIELLPDFCFAHGMVHLGVLDEAPETSASVRARTLWSVLSGLGIPVGVIGWPLTYPAPAVRGYVVSDRFQQLGEAALDLEDDLVYPPDLLASARAAAGRPRVDPLVADVARTATTGASAPPSAARRPLALDATNEQVFADLQDLRPAQVVAVRFQALDGAGHFLLRYAAPRAFGDVSEEERRRYGRLLEQHYAFVDAMLGRIIATRRPDDLLLVVSGFGIEPMSIGKRLLEGALGNPDLSGTHETAPDGFVIAFGENVAAGRLPRASVVDVAPTVLYYLGLPVARDMDGYARTDIFTPAFTAERPIAFVPTYER
jgi:type I phosphodiesterase/nucleotide pyrophosphatase